MTNSRIEDRGLGIDAIFDLQSTISNPRVGVTSLPSPAYTSESASGGEVPQALNRLAKEMRWSEGEREEFNPFGRMIPRGARVLVKPNLVLHENEGPWGIEPLVTHISLIRAVVEGVLRAEPS